MASQNVSLEISVFERLEQYMKKHELPSKTKAVENMLKKCELEIYTEDN